MNEQSLPIDIHTNKLLDWLISRRHCNKDWMKKLTDIRQKIKKAIQDMPESEEIAKLLSRSQINYYTCTKIVNILKETEADTKNVFGYYSSQRMKDWQEVVKLYEKDNVYLTEVAQILARNVNYEVPSLRKQMEKLQSTVEESRRKQVESVKQSNLLKAEYNSSAASLGIQGKDIKKELLELLLDIPKFASELYTGILSIEHVREFYNAFLTFVNSSSEVQCTPVLCYLLKNGNTTYYEYSRGEKPEVIEELKGEGLSDGSDVAASSQEDQIDFGDDGGIDFGEETASSETTSGTNGDFVHIEKCELDLPEPCNNTHADEINWDAGPEVSVIETTNNSKIARGSDAFSLLEHSITRNLIINEICELEGFLEQRLTEMKQEGDVLSSGHFQSAPSLIQLTNDEGVSKMLAEVRKILADLTTDKMKLLYLLKDNPKYIDNAVQKFKHKSELAEKFLAKAKNFETKEAECLQETREISSRIQPLIMQTRDIQSQIEDDISERYNGRPVNIMGGVQML